MRAEMRVEGQKQCNGSGDETQTPESHTPDTYVPELGKQNKIKNPGFADKISNSNISIIFTHALVSTLPPIGSR